MLNKRMIDFNDRHLSDGFQQTKRFREAIEIVENELKPPNAANILTDYAFERC